MKFLAILKDSLREALDTWTLYATLIVSALIVLLMASVTYRPVPAQEQFHRFTEGMNWLLEFSAQGRAAPRYEIVDFQQTNDATDPWKGDYHFVFLIDVPDEKAVEEIKERKLLPPPEEMKKQFKQTFKWIGDLEIKEVPSDKKTEIRYDMQTKGTKAADRREWVHEPRLFFGAVPLTIFQAPLAKILEFVTDDLIGTFGAAITLLLGTIITAFFIPNMLRKGSVDLLLAKPMHRVTLLCYKFVGGLTFMFLNTVVIMFGLWLAIGLQAGVWINGLLWCVGIFTFQFSIFYSVSTLTGVLTRSPIVAILVSVVAWAVLLGSGWGYRVVDAVRPEKVGNAPEQKASILPGWVYPSVDTLHFILPHYKDLDRLTTKLIRSDLLDHSSQLWKDTEKDVGSTNWTESIGVTVFFIALMVGLSIWRFATKDY